LLRIGYLEDLVVLVAQLNQVGSSWLLHLEGRMVLKRQWVGLKVLMMIIP